MDFYLLLEPILKVRICALLGYYAAYSGNSLRTFLDNLSAPSSRDRFLKMAPIMGPAV